MTRHAWVLVLALAGCDAGGKALQAMANPAAQQEGGQSAGPALGVADEQGALLDQRAVAGKVVIVDFWASWCQPCQHSIPFYRRMHERFRNKGLLVVGVNTDDEKPNMVSYLMSHPLPFSVVWDEKKALTGRFGVAQLPTTFLFDRRGRLRKTRSGFDPAEARSVEDEIRLLLGEDGG
jgi:thiol-disulfide isomerase/thioredoxin